MEIKDIYELWDRFEGSTALELDVEVGGGRLHLRRDAGNRGAAGFQKAGSHGTINYDAMNQGAMNYDDARVGAMNQGSMSRNSRNGSGENNAVEDQSYKGKEYSSKEYSGRYVDAEHNPGSNPEIPSEDKNSNRIQRTEKVITAPLVGTFYRGSEPGGEPFVKEGQQVKKGDRLCIIEAMKLMNEVTASEDGEILEIPAQDGSLVEYGETLFIFK